MAEPSTPRRCRAGGRSSPSPRARELLKAADLDPQRDQPGRPGRQRRHPRRRRARAARVRPRDRHRASPRPSWARALLDYADPRALGTVGLQSRDYAMAGFEDADVVIAIGYDLVEHAPKHWNPRARQEDRRDRLRGRRDRRATSCPRSSSIGDIYHVLSRLAEECRDVPHSGGSQRLRDVVLGRFEAAKDDDALPDAAAARAVGDPPGARAARTSSSPTSACTSCGSGACSPPTSPTR